MRIKIDGNYFDIPSEGMITFKTIDIRNHFNYSTCDIDMHVDKGAIYKCDIYSIRNISLRRTRLRNVLLGQIIEQGIFVEVIEPTTKGSEFTIRYSNNNPYADLIADLMEVEKYNKSRGFRRFLSMDSDTIEFEFYGSQGCRNYASAMHASDIIDCIKDKTGKTPQWNRQKSWDSNSLTHAYNFKITL